MKRYQTRVPSGYQEVEYLKSNGTQYIDTNIIPTNSAQTKVQFEFQLTDITNGIYQSIGCNSNMNFTSSQALLKFRSNAIEIADFDTAWHICEISKSSSGKVTYFDGVEYSTSAVTEEAIPFLLFGMSLSADRYYGKYKLKYFKCYENNTLVRNMIPVRRVSDNVLGMYDIANDVFYTNQGTGTFEAGADVDNWQTKSPPRYGTATDAVTNLPVTIITDGQPVSSYTIKGNTSTSGTLLPQNPITINGVGEKTANLFNSAWEQGSINGTTGENNPSNSMVRTVDYIPVEYNKTYSISRSVKSSQNNLRFYNAQKQYIGTGDNTRIELIVGSSVTNPMATNVGFCCFKIIDSNIAYMRMNDYSNNTSTQYMMLEGEYTEQTMPSYEPYGYKISISSNQTALTPVYLTEPLMLISTYADSLASSGTVTRNIKKVVFTGQEATSSLDPSSNIFAIRGIFNSQPEILQVGGLCTHYKYNNAISSLSANMQDGDFVLNKIVNDYSFTIRDAAMSSAEDFKTFLQQQYAAGTPVTVYYVIETATTESVTAPTITTTGGEVSIDVDTTVKPSEMSLTYHGWHSHEPLKRENGSWS